MNKILNVLKKRVKKTYKVVKVTRQGNCPTKFKPGRYTSKYGPSSAAKKAFNNLCRLKNIRGQCTLWVTVKETTRGSKHKEFTYKCSRQKLAKPVIRKVKKDGVEKKFKIEYNVVCKKAIRPSVCKGNKQTVGRMKKIVARKEARAARDLEL